MATREEHLAEIEALMQPDPWGQAHLRDVDLLMDPRALLALGTQEQGGWA